MQATKSLKDTRIALIGIECWLQSLFSQEHLFSLISCHSQNPNGVLNSSYNQVYHSGKVLMTFSVSDGWTYKGQTATTLSCAHCCIHFLWGCRQMEQAPIHKLSKHSMPISIISFRRDAKKTTMHFYKPLTRGVHKELTTQQCCIDGIDFSSTHWHLPLISNTFYQSNM